MEKYILSLLLLFWVVVFLITLVTIGVDFKSYTVFYLFTWYLGIFVFGFLGALRGFVSSEGLMIGHDL